MPDPLEEIRLSDIAEALEVLLRALPGVNAVYPSGPLPAVIAGSVLAAHTPLAPRRPVSVTITDSETRVTAVIGVTSSESAAEIGGSARETIIEHLRLAGMPSARVTVRIGMVG